MMKTEKLYYIDSHLTAFSARVLRCDSLEDGRFAVVLDRTAFFPEGGGQSADTGLFHSMVVPQFFVCLFVWFCF